VLKHAHLTGEAPRPQEDCHMSVFLLLVQLDKVARREVTAINTSVYNK